MKFHWLVKSGTSTIGWMDDLYEIAMEAEKIFTF